MYRVAVVGYRLCADGSDRNTTRDDDRRARRSDYHGGRRGNDGDYEVAIVFLFLLNNNDISNDDNDDNLITLSSWLDFSRQRPRYRVVLCGESALACFGLNQNCRCSAVQSTVVTSSAAATASVEVATMRAWLVRLSAAFSVPSTAKKTTISFWVRQTFCLSNTRILRTFGS